MSDAQKQLVDAIRRIAKSDPEVRGALDFLRKRGALPEVSVTAVPEEDASCCDSPGEFGPDPDNPDGGGGGRNPDGSWSPPGSDPDTEWNDCETGDPISFDPAGFPQPETCKGDCERDDPTWVQGYYWRYSQLDSPDCSRYGASAAQAAANRSAGTTIIYRLAVRDYDIDGTVGSYWYQVYYPTTGEWNNTFSMIVRVSCAAHPNSCATGYCELTEPPIIDECTDWEEDGKTNYTLANGCIVASSCDPDASEQSQQCNECINMCDSEGNQWTVCGTGDGGFVAYDPSGEKDGVKYDYNGNPQSTIPAGSGRGIF